MGKSLYSLLIIAATMLLATFSAQAGTVKNLVDLQQVDLPTDQSVYSLTSTQAWCCPYYYDDTCTYGYAWPLPQDSSDWFAVRFTQNETSACALTTVRVRLDGTLTTGTPDLQIGIYDDDGFGLPGTLLATATVPNDSLPPEQFGWAEVDFAPTIFDPGEEFHIGIKTVGGAGDTLYALSDAGTGPHFGENRSETHFPSDGQWYTLSAKYGLDYVFMIEAEVSCADNECIAPPSGMVAWWPLDEASGPTAGDIAGSVNNSGTWINSPVPVPGKVGGALSFNGSNSVDVPDDPELNFGTGDFSVDLWINTTSASGTSPIMDKRTGSIPNITGFVLYLYNGYLGLQISDGSGYFSWTSTGFVADGNWHHIAVTVDRDNPMGWLYYVDGVAVGTPANPTAYQGSLTNTAPFVIARDLVTPSHTFAGTLDEIDLFNRVLDPLEIFNIWAADSFGKCKDTCYADGDANYDGLPLSVADMTYLDDFINGCGPAPVPLYSCDLNGDGFVNAADLQLYQDYFSYGMGVFTNGYPVSCPCVSIPQPEPDIISIFGMEHVSLGSACFDTVDGGLNVSRIWGEPVDTLVDANGDTIIVIAHPAKAAGSGGGPYGTSISNLEDAGIMVTSDVEDDSTFNAGATIQTEVYGFVDGEPDQLIASTVQTKQQDSSWALGVKAEVQTYSVKAYLGNTLVWSNDSIPATGDWFQMGTFSKGDKAAGSDGGPYGTSISNLEDAGIINIEFEPGDTVVWNWESQGVYNLQIDRGNVDGDPEEKIDISDLTYLVQYAINIDSFTIASESYGVDYKGQTCSNLGNASIVRIDSSLQVTNCGASGGDGVLCMAPKDDDIVDPPAPSSDSTIKCIIANPDPSGTLPVGAAIKAEFSNHRIGFPPPEPIDPIAFAISMTKTGASTWDIAFESDGSLYTIEAYRNDVLVFSVDSIPDTNLGYITDASKGVYPVGFKGGASNKPANIIAWQDPSGVPWNWAAYGVSALTVDAIKVTIEDFTTAGDTLVSVMVTATDMPSFTILDIVRGPTSCCTNPTGDINNDGGTLVDISDLLFLVDYMFLPPGTALEPECMEEANVDGLGGELPDISDLLFIVDYMFLAPGTAPAPADCL